MLIVGAGAVGQVYGWHLQRGGATVGLVIRPRQREEAAAGFVHYPLNEGRDPKVIRRVWRDYTAVETPEQVAAAGPWDQLWLCVSATALTDPSMRPLIEAAGPNTTVVLLTPGPDDLGCQKPDPRVLDAVATRLGRRVDLFVGDGGTDVGVARAAGIPVVGVRWGLKPDEVQGADVVIDRTDQLAGAILGLLSST